MRIALAHDYLTQRGGAERVALAMARAFPGAPLYTSVYAPEQTFPGFADVDVRTSFLQAVPAFRRDPRLALPILPAAWLRRSVEPCDVLIASSSGWAHGLGAPEGTARVVYCHNPPRWLYQTQEYLPGALGRAALSPLRPALLGWDQRAAASADRYLANSTAVAARVQRVYGIEAEVLHPPVAIDVDGPQEPVEGLGEGFWLTVARGRGYKNVQAVVDGVGRLGDGRLAVVGSAPDDAPAAGHVSWLGVVSDAQLRWLYAHARALISVSFEDFGLTPLEANAYGTPVAVLRAGGFLDSTREGESGAFIEAPTADAVHQALAALPDFDPAAVRAHARRFDVQAFTERLRQVAAEVTGAGAAPAPAASSARTLR